MTEFEKTVFELTSAVRFLPAHDCIGIPLFSSRPLNATFFAETDERLGIDAFHIFDSENANTEQITEFAGFPQYYRVGDPAPIPIWVAGKQQVIVANRGWESVAEQLDTNHPVVGRLSRTLRKAQEAENESLPDPLAQVREFLAEPPTPDRHWVTRFRDVLSQASGPPLFKQEYLLDQLGDVANLWASACAAKANTKILRDFLDAIVAFGAGQRPFSEAQSLAIMRHIAARPSASRLVTRDIEKLSKTTGAPGIVEYLQASDRVADEAFKASYEQVAKGLRAALIHGKRSEIENFAKLFGTARTLPPQVAEVAHHLASFKNSELRNIARMVFSPDSNEHSIYVIQSVASQALETARLLEAVYKLIYPDQREADLYRTALMGISRETLNELRYVAEGQLPLSSR